MSALWTEAHSLAATRWAKPVFDLPRAVPPPPLPDRAEQLARLAAVETEAQQAGFTAGHAAGLAEGRMMAAGIAAQLRSLLDAMAKPLAVIDHEMERVLVALTLEAARRIAQQELHLDPAKVAAVVRDAVASLGSGITGIAVYVHPDDYAALADVLGVEMQTTNAWRLVADPEVLPGGCRVQSEQASVVASLDARAAGLAHTLLSQA